MENNRRGFFKTIIAAITGAVAAPVVPKCIGIGPMIAYSSRMAKIGQALSTQKPIGFYSPIQINVEKEVEFEFSAAELELLHLNYFEPAAKAWIHRSDMRMAGLIS